MAQAVIDWEDVLDNWVTHRLQDATVTNGLTETTDGIYNSIRPQQITPGLRFVTFHRTGMQPAQCIDGLTTGMYGEYVMQVWDTSYDLGGLSAIKLAMGARFEGVTESYQGILFTDMGQLPNAPHAIDVSEGVGYSTTGYRRGIYAEVA